jgi:hypothetical protein
VPTRSTRLASLIPAPGVATSALTVPAGMTYLIKDVLVSNFAGAGDTVDVYAQDGAGVQGRLFMNQAVPTITRAEWSGFVALNAGDQLFVRSVQGSTHFWVSGTKLVGVA